MNARTGTARPLPIVALVVLALAGCGGGGGDPAPVASDPNAVLGASQTVTGGSSARTAKECLDPQTLRSGRVVRRQTRGPGGAIGEATTTVVGAVVRGGRTMTQVRADALPNPTGAQAYALQQLAGDDLLALGFGSAVVDASGRTVTVEGLMSQGVPTGFSLPVGGSASYGPVTVVASMRVGGGAPTEQTTTALFTVRFVGFETIDLPAGRFVDACRIETRSTESGTTTTVTDWYANGTGALLKSRANDGSETVVTALSIDGRLLAGQFVTVASGAGAGSSSGAGTGGAKR